MKFSDFLNEANATAAAISEIESIELLAEDDGFELIVYFTNQDIKEHEAEKAEEARVKAIVKKMNAENKTTKPAKKAPPRFPGRK